jgi:uncharacterized protein (DUF302 family)
MTSSACAVLHKHNAGSQWSHRMHEGLQSLTTHHTVDETVARLQTILTAKGIKLFCLVDHSGEAAAVGLTMPPTKLLIFGNPKAGTPLMLAAPTTALDLPLKILVTQSPTGETLITWNDPAYLQQRHNFPIDLAANLAAAANLAKAAAE